MMSVAAQSAFAATLLGESATETPLYNDALSGLNNVLYDRKLAADGTSNLL